MRSFLLFPLLVLLFIFPSSGQQEIPDISAWIEYMTPGDMHKLMQNDVGEWKTTMKFWTDPSVEPTVSYGHAKIEMVLGGRYLKSTHTGSNTEMPMEGIGYQAFDNLTKEFISTWIDNMGTGIMVSKGKYDPETKTCILFGSMVDPILKKEVPFKEINRNINEDKMIMEMFATYDGVEVKNMEIILERIK
ncbi:MAG: DUF1579 domain-containing protein [Ignavibacteriaceae bacterium]